MGTKFTVTEFIAKAKEVHAGKYDYSKTVYTRSRDKVVIICPVHGAFEQRASSHLDGCGCPDCQKEWSAEHKAKHAAAARRSRGMTTIEWIERARAVHGDRYDYSQVNYVNQRTDVTIICKKHGPFVQKADSHLRGCGCRLCGFESENHNSCHAWSDEQRQKTTNTCMQRYGAPRYLDSEIGRAKHIQIKSDPAFRAKMRKIISSDDVQSRIKATSMARYGVESPAKLKDVQDKIYASKKRNHTVNSSKAEQTAYEMLVSKFGTDAVVHHYKDADKYPFVCDFYIRPLDLYIELNIHWSHGHGWFLGTDADLAQLAEWRNKADSGSAYYACAIRTWTERDVAKRNMAIRHRLNYLAFWDSDLSDFTKWLNSDDLTVSNISH